MRNRSNMLLGCVLLCSASLLYLGMNGIDCPRKSRRSRWMELNMGNQSLPLTEHFPEDTPLIFIGGFPRSGTTLMRVMLDAHNAVRCGEETRVIPRLLAMRATWSRSVKEKLRLDEAGVTDQVLDAAVRAFLLEVGGAVWNTLVSVNILDSQKIGSTEDQHVYGVIRLFLKGHDAVCSLMCQTNLINKNNHYAFYS